MYRIFLFAIISLLVAGSLILNRSVSGSNSESFNKPFKITLNPAVQEDFLRFEKTFKEEIADKLPEDSRISIVFYNRNKGYWEAERYYFATKNKVFQTNSAKDADLKIIMNSRWLTLLNEMSFCNIVKNARANRDFDIELTESKTSLLWKYKSLMDYKECLGF